MSRDLEAAVRVGESRTVAIEQNEGPVKFRVPKPGAAGWEVLVRGVLVGRVRATYKNRWRWALGAEGFWSDRKTISRRKAVEMLLRDLAGTR
jgi:hypothetical protein